MNLLRAALGTTFVVAAATSGMSGCATPEWVDLATADQWTPVDPASDTWPGAPADAAPCDARAVAVEDGAVELDTTFCDWITLEATAAADVDAGADIDLFALHAALTADAPAEAVMGVRVGDDVLWEVTRPIPSTDAWFAETFPCPVDIAAGDRLLLHVHNHGANTYRLGHLRAWTKP